MRFYERNIVSFLRRHQIILVSVSLALFSLHLALTDKKEVARGVLLKEAISLTVSPIQNLTLSIYGGATGIWSDYINLVGVKDENESLKNRISALQDENNRLKETVGLNARLRSLLEYKQDQEFHTAAAGITGFNMDKWTRTAVINKGRAEGIKKDLAVISPLGVVGRVIDVEGHSARVLLNTDIRSNIDVLVQRTRVKGVVEGNGTDGLRLKYVRQVDDVQVGDQILTSGLSGIFPKGLVIGEVTKIEMGGDSFFKYVEVRPKVDIQRLEEVLVVTDDGFSE